MKDTVGKLNPYRFRGYRYDSETGLYYLQSRYYNPEICRMLNADNVGGKIGQLNSHNVFQYCFNNPVNMSDPSGHWAFAIQTKIANAFASFMTAVVVVAVVSYVAVSEAAKKVKSLVETTENILKTRNQSVYALEDPSDGKVKYIGRTNDPVRRLKQHQNDKKHPERKKYEMKVFATGLNIPEAKIAEQAAISAYTLEYLDNARREIGKGNIAGYKNNMGAVVELFGSVAEDELMNLMGR